MEWFDKNISFHGTILDKKKEYVIFGDKEYLENCDILLNAGINISCFCEQNDLICGMSGVLAEIEVLTLRCLLMLKKKEPILIISSIGYGISESLVKYGFSDISVLDTNWFMSCVDNTRAILKARDKISEVLSLLEDEESKRVYKSVINAKLTLNSNYLSQVADETNLEYFDTELINFSEDEIFIDGGSYNGDTSLLLMAKLKGKFKKILMFEPDNYCFNVIKSRLSFFKDDRLECLNQGLYDKKGTIGFKNLRGGSSCIQEDADIIIETDCLDNIIKEATFIKLDIEGAEAKAIKGAKNLITACKPKLAVCLYHNHEDLWELPLLIKSLEPSYKLYIRQYSNFFCISDTTSRLQVLDTICYAIHESEACNKIYDEKDCKKSVTEEKIDKHWSSVYRHINADEAYRENHWWENDFVKRYINKLVFNIDSPINSEGLNQLLKKRLNGRRLKAGVSVGCGVNLKEIRLIELGIVERFILFDLSEEAVKISKEKIKQLGLCDKVECYCEDAFSFDFNGIEVDLVYWNNSLHHMFDVAAAVKWSYDILQPGGVFFMDDYVGPNRFQFTDNVIRIVNEVRGLISDDDIGVVIRTDADKLAEYDPSEAVDSERILESVKTYFPHAEITLTGGIVYFIALANTYYMFDEENEEHMHMLERLMEIDRLYTKHPGIPSLYATALAFKQ